MSNKGKQVDSVEEVIKGIDEGTVKQIDFDDKENMTVYSERQPKEKLELISYNV